MSATQETYTYDAVGNRLSSLGVSPYTYNSSNELQTIPGVTYAYDNNGNLQTKTDASGATGYTWDYENRLTQVSMPGTAGTVNYKYDPFGRRVQKAFTQGGNTTTTNYVYDGANAIEELDQFGVAAARYVQGPGVDEPLMMQRAGAVSYYEADGLGTVTSLSTTAGALANTYTYDSFGKLTASSGTVVNPYRYTGRELDSETGMYYYRARYYDQATGRFLSGDPLTFGSDTNFYSYVGNDPTGLTDPSGMLPVAGVGVGYSIGGGITGVAVGTGSWAGPIGAGFALLIAWDGYYGYQYGVASGWWGQPKPEPQAQVQPGPQQTQAQPKPTPKPSGTKQCKKRKKDDDCLKRYLAEQLFCLRYKGTVLHGMCLERAQWRFSTCARGLPDPGPLDPLDPNWSID